jgi:hypothetical protein
VPCPDSAALATGKAEYGLDAPGDTLFACPSYQQKHCKGE